MQRANRCRPVINNSPIHTAALAAVLLFALAAQPQAEHPIAKPAQSASVASKLTIDDSLPESGTLSAHEYRNAHYSFALDLPEAANSVQLRTSPMPRGVHALLAMSFPDPPVKTEVWINSFDSSSGQTLDPAAAASELVASLAKKRDMLGFEPLPIHPERKGGLQILEQYKYSEKRLILDVFFSRRGHLLRLTATTTEPDRAGFKAWLLKAIRLDTSATALAEGEPYFGPTLPDAVIERTIATHPGRDLPADHRVQGANYINNTLGLRYRFPFQWKVLDLNSPHPKFFLVDADEAPVAARRHELFTACTKLLLRLAGPDKEDDKQALSLIAINPACLGITSPLADTHSRPDLSRVLLEYPDFGEVRSAEYTKIAGQTFLVVRSLLPDKNGIDGLRERVMQTVYITHRNEQMLFWFFTAKTQSAMPTFNVEFVSPR